MSCTRWVVQLVYMCIDIYIIEVCVLLRAWKLWRVWRESAHYYPFLSHTCNVSPIPEIKIQMLKLHIAIVLSLASNYFKAFLSMSHLKYRVNGIYGLPVSCLIAYQLCKTIIRPFLSATKSFDLRYE